MNILIVRTRGSKTDDKSYNVPEIELAKALVRAGHQADVVLYGGLKDDRTVLKPVDDTGIVRIDERLLGEDADIDEGEIVPDDDRFISVYYLSGFRILKGAVFMSLKDLSAGYDAVMMDEYAHYTAWRYYSDRRWAGKVFIYQRAYADEHNKLYTWKCRCFDHTFLKLKPMLDTACFASDEKAARHLAKRGFDKVGIVGMGLDTDTWDELTESDISGALLGTAGTEFGKALKAAGRKEERFFTFTYKGRLSPGTNTMFLMDLADRLLSRYEDVRFVIIGDGDPEYKARCLARMRKWKNDGRFIHATDLIRQEMPALFGMTDCIIDPAVYDDGDPVIYEAVYNDTPVITSRAAEPYKLLRDGENAMVMKELTLGSWIEAACRMHDDTAMRNNMKVALLEDKDKLKWDVVVGRMLKGLSDNGRRRAADKA